MHAPFFRISTLEVLAWQAGFAAKPQALAVILDPVKDGDGAANVIDVALFLTHH